MSSYRLFGHTYRWWGFVGIHAGVESLLGQLITERSFQLELLAILAGQLIGQWVEVQTASNRQSSYQFGAVRKKTVQLIITSIKISYTQQQGLRTDLVESKDGRHNG